MTISTLFRTLLSRYQSQKERFSFEPNEIEALSELILKADFARAPFAPFAMASLQNASLDKSALVFCLRLIHGLSGHAVIEKAHAMLDDEQTRDAALKTLYTATRNVDDKRFELLALAHKNADIRHKSAQMMSRFESNVATLSIAREKPALLDFMCTKASAGFLNDLVPYAHKHGIAERPKKCSLEIFKLFESQQHDHDSLAQFYESALDDLALKKRRRLSYFACKNLALALVRLERKTGIGTQALIAAHDVKEIPRENIERVLGTSEFIACGHSQAGVIEHVFDGVQKYQHPKVVFASAFFLDRRPFSASLKRPQCDEIIIADPTIFLYEVNDKSEQRAKHALLDRVFERMPGHRIARLTQLGLGHDRHELYAQLGPSARRHALKTLFFAETTPLKQNFDDCRTIASYFFEPANAQTLLDNHFSKDEHSLALLSLCLDALSQKAFDALAQKPNFLALANAESKHERTRVLIAAQTKAMQKSATQNASSLNKSGRSQASPILNADDKAALLSNAFEDWPRLYSTPTQGLSKIFKSLDVQSASALLASADDPQEVAALIYKHRELSFEDIRNTLILYAEDHPGLGVFASALLCAFKEHAQSFETHAKEIGAAQLLDIAARDDRLLAWTLSAFARLSRRALFSKASALLNDAFAKAVVGHLDEKHCEESVAQILSTMFAKGFSLASSKAYAQKLYPSLSPSSQNVLKGWLEIEDEPREKPALVELAIVKNEAREPKVARVNLADQNETSLYDNLEHAFRKGHLLDERALQKRDRVFCAEAFLLASRLSSAHNFNENALKLCEKADQKSAQAILHLIIKESDDEACVQKANTKYNDAARDQKLGQLAALSLYAMRESQRLLQRSLNLRFSSKGLAHTQLEADFIVVNPLPLLRGERFGEEVVQGLIVHEIGHHLFHASDDAQKIWQEAREQKRAGLLNLVCDEHLERNLRALDAKWGDNLKRTAAYAFKHGKSTLDAHAFLSNIDEPTLRALRGSFSPAKERKLISIKSRDLDRGFSKSEEHRSFTDFVRALRLGLGTRSGDQKVARALALFAKPNFKSAKMRELNEMALAIADIFGERAVSLLENLGFHERTRAFESEFNRQTCGIKKEDIERVLKSAAGKGVHSPQIDRSERLGFRALTQIERLPFKAHPRVQHSAVRRLAHAFDQMGNAKKAQERRTSGARLSRQRLVSKLINKDPRMLRAHKRVNAPDLFLGVLIDASSSMNAGDRLVRAKLFAKVLAQALHASAFGARGIESRFMGFNDHTIYDAGTHLRLAIDALRASGGNNDAGALYQMRNLARASRKQRKLIIMLSDGSPTHCSVKSLRNLVAQIERRDHIMCAQVALRAIEDVCFTRYIELLDSDIDRGARRFANIVADVAHQRMTR